MNFQNCRITKEITIVLLIIFCSIAFSFLISAVTAAGDEIQDNFTLIDINGIEINNISNLHLYYSEDFGMWYRPHTSYSIDVKRGDTTHSIPFNQIKEIKFSWADQDENSTIIVLTQNGKEINGIPIIFRSNLIFSGDIENGSISQAVRKTLHIFRKGSNVLAIQNPSPGVNGNNEDIFTITDLSGVKTEGVSNLHLYYSEDFGMWYRPHTSYSVDVKRGETTDSFLYSDINAIIFSWSDTSEKSQVTVFNKSGKRFTGYPVQINNDWTLYGDTDYGTINQDLRKTSQIVREGVNLASLKSEFALPDFEEFVDLLWGGGETFVNFINPANFYNNIKELF